MEEIDRQENKNRITIESDQETIYSFHLALRLLDLTPEKAFKRWVRELSDRALGAEEKQGTILKTVSADSASRPRPKVYAIPSMEHRIQGWARRKDGYAYAMLCAFFATCDEAFETHRGDMEDVFYKMIGQEKGDRSYQTFLMVFRQMSSTSVTAYGPVFVYRFTGGNDLVLLNPISKDTVLSLKEEFVMEDK